VRLQKLDKGDQLLKVVLVPPEAEDDSADGDSADGDAETSDTETIDTENNAQDS
jgi:DNA gyrase subunit A